MMYMSVRMMTFGDIPLHRNRLRPVPNRLHINIPHTNEIPVAEPLRMALKKKLEEKGLPVTLETNLRMAEDGWELRRKVHGTRLKAGTVSSVLSIEDQRMRLRSMHERTREPGSVYLEMHAYRMAGKDDHFSEVHDWRRLGRTMILAMSDLPAYFLESLETHCWSIAKDRSSSEIARLRGFDLKMAVEECRSLLKEVRKRRDRVKLIEIPGEFEDLTAGHTMRRYYFQESGLYAMLPTEYEMQYCAGAFLPREPEDKEVEQVGRLIGSV